MNLELLKVLYKNRKYLIITTFVGFILGIIISFIIPSKYKSIAVIYPSNIISNKGIIYEDKLLSNNDATNTEVLMQFTNSNEIKNQLMNKFNLDKHYELNKNDDKFSAYFNYYYYKNFKFSQTKYESILIEVYDKDPVMAQKLADGLITEINLFVQKSVNKIIQEKIFTLNNTLERITKKSDSLKTIIKNFSTNYNLFDYNLQIEQLARSYYKNVPQKSISEFNPELKKISENGYDFFQISEEFKSNLIQANTIRLEIFEEQAKASSSINYIQVISKPEIPSEKDSPKRILVILLVTFCVLLFSCLSIVLKDKYQKIKDAIV